LTKKIGVVPLKEAWTPQGENGVLVAPISVQVIGEAATSSVTKTPWLVITT
jgi:hypothetical protein